MGILLQVLALAVGIVSLVCWIMILVKIFKQNVGLGILGIFCSIFAFIYGWVKVKEFNAQKIMTVWTIAIVVGMIANFLGAGAMIQEMIQQLQSAGG